MELVDMDRGTMDRAQSAVLLAAGVAALPVLYAINPAQSRLFPLCPFLWLTGWQCPGCGSLRAMHQLLHGELGAALALNPLMIILLPLLLFVFTRQFAVRLRPSSREFVLPASWTWGLLWLTLAWTVARNLPA